MHPNKKPKATKKSFDSLEIISFTQSAHKNTPVTKTIFIDGCEVIDYTQPTHETTAVLPVLDLYHEETNQTETPTQNYQNTQNELVTQCENLKQENYLLHDIVSTQQTTIDNLTAQNSALNKQVMALQKQIDDIHSIFSEKNTLSNPETFSISSETYVFYLHNAQNILPISYNDYLATRNYPSDALFNIKYNAHENIPREITTNQKNLTDKLLGYFQNMQFTLFVSNKKTLDNIKKLASPYSDYYICQKDDNQFVTCFNRPDDFEQQKTYYQNTTNTLLYFFNSHSNITSAQMMADQVNTSLIMNN